MLIKQITNNNFKDEWNKFVIQHSSPSAFLQSWQWGDFKNKNNNLLRFVIEENNKIVALAQFFKIALPGKKFYLNCPYGPILNSKIKNQNSKVFNLIISEIKKIAKQEKIVFFRIAPPYTKNYELHLPTGKAGITNYGLRIPKILRNLKEPASTLILDLKHSTEDLLKNMHHKTRYNIRLAQRKNVQIKTISNIDEFYNLIQQTARRDKINIFSKNYYKKLLLNPCSLLLIAYYKKQPLSAIILYNFGNTATYLYGASANQKRNLMPNYLIQWQAIQYAKSQGYQYYDFWGYDENKTKWSGINRFKKGFVSEQTGKKINYLGSFDYILNKKWYNLYRFFTPLQRLKSKLF